nr:MAG TPA: hypothetical protein [Caudoviricetes sp.]
MANLRVFSNSPLSFAKAPSMPSLNLIQSR